MNQNESTDSRNQFMNNSADMSSLAKIMEFTKEIMKNPSMMEEMERRLNEKQQQNNSSFIKNLNTDRANSSIDQSASMLMMGNDQRDFQNQGLSANESSIANQSMVKRNNFINQEGRKKGQDVLSQYLSHPTENTQKSRENNWQENEEEENALQKSPVSSKPKAANRNKPVPSFDDIPIKSSYAENKIVDPDMIYQVDDPNAYGPNGKFNGSASLVQKKNTSSRIQKTQDPKPQSESESSKNKYQEAEERPICGTKKDFRDHLKEQCGQLNNPIEDTRGEQPDDHQNQQQSGAAPKRQFLKRGSRQYLSSAKDKKAQSKKPKNTENENMNMNASRLRDDKSLTPAKRQVSQNRVLGKRNNQKFQTKIKTRKLDTSQNESFVDPQQSYNELPPRRSITPKNQRSITPKNQRPENKIKPSAIPPQPSKKQTITSNKSGVSNSGASSTQRHLKNNVFDDSSSSEIDDDEPKFKGRSNNFMEPKQLDRFSRQKKIQYVEGVFLTKTQINLIRQKMSSEIQQQKLKPQAQEKFNELRRKYTDLCALVQRQKIEQEDQMEAERQKFEQFKQTEIQKIKNQRRVMERQLKSSMPSHSQTMQKDKQEVENLKKELEKEKDEHRKKDKNNKILIEKYKKEVEELKMRLERMEEDLQSHKNFNTHNGSFAALDSKSVEVTKSQSQSVKNDRSKSKSGFGGNKREVTKSPNKFVKKQKETVEKYSEDETEANYKKTVPFKGQKASTQYGSGNHKLEEDDQLPTFKINDKKQEKKKYQFVEVQNNSSSQYGKKPASTSSKNAKKNVFINDPSDYSDSASDDNAYNEGESSNNFFKSNTSNANRYDSLQAIAESDDFSIKDVNSVMIQKLFKYNTNSEYKKYLERVNNPRREIKNSVKNDTQRKITNIYSDRSKQVLFENGVKKEIFEDGYTIIYFKNGDIKQKLTDGSIIYFFREKQVDQITLSNDLNIYRFDNNQVELHFNKGQYIEIRHPDGTFKVMGGNAR